MVLDGARADEQLGADLRVRLPVARHPSDLRLLRRQDIAGFNGSLGRGLAGGHQLAAGALGKPLTAEGAEYFVGGPELLTRVDAPVLATQPFAVKEPRPGEVNHATAVLEPLDRLLVERLRMTSLAQQGARAGLDAERPIGGALARAFAQALERGGGLVASADADAGLYQLDESPTVRDDILVLACPVRGRDRLVVAAVAVVHQGGHPREHANREALAPHHRTGEVGVGNRLHPRLIAPPRSQEQRGVVERRDRRRLRYRSDLVDHLLGGVDRPGMDVERAQEVGHAREQGERAGVARDPHPPSRELVPQLVVPEILGHATRQP